MDVMLSSKIINSSIGNVPSRNQLQRVLLKEGGFYHHFSGLINNVLKDLEVNGTKVVAYADDVVLLIA